MKKITSKIQKAIGSSTICEMQLWPPDQGSLPEVIPISVDIDFDSEEIRTAKYKFSLVAKRATIKLQLEDAEMVRGSRLGEQVRSEEMVAQITQSVRSTLETQVNMEGYVNVEVLRNPVGHFFAKLNWLKRKTNKKEDDFLLESSYQIRRVTPRTNGRWEIAEPLQPHILSGRYLGADGKNESCPLCLLTMRGTNSVVKISVLLDLNDVLIKLIGGTNIKKITKNKEAVLAQLVRRSISNTLLNESNTPISVGTESVTLAYSRMEIKIDN